MDDIEKNRVLYVQQLEAKLKYLQAEHDKYKSAAERWEPKVVTNIDTKSGDITIGLQFGGKHIHTKVSTVFLQQTDIVTAVSGVTDVLVESLVVEQLRKIIAPELERLQRGAIATQNAGKW